MSDDDNNKPNVVERYRNMLNTGMTIPLNLTPYSLISLFELSAFSFSASR